MAALYSRLDGDDDKPLPSLPSPTLTNPDMVLPDNGFVDFTTSPPRSIRLPGFSQNDLHTPPRQQNERRGLMSRKMMLQRSQTDSQTGHAFSTPREDASLPMASSPLLHDQLTIKPGSTERRDSGSSMDSDELAAMPEFLQKYRNVDITDDDMTEAEGAHSEIAAYDAQRRVKEEEEQVSARLSKRAEEILANAKKRLNLMEGNLRGARDLVAPLTAANLKRATSLSYTGSSPLSYAHRRLDSITYDTDPYNPSRRMLLSQASSPTMRHDFYGHARGGSDLELERPHTSMSRSRFPIRTPGSAGRSPDISSNPALRSAKSYDSFGISKLLIPTDAKARSKNSPDSSLEPVSEDEAQAHIETSYRNSSRAPEVVPAIGLGVSHLAPPSTAGSAASEDLRDQMASLKGRISSLRERAHEDRMRRASASSLRNTTIFNNASDGAPELWYNQSSSQGSPPSSSPPRWTSGAPAGSRNAFAEQVQRRRDAGLPSDSSDSYSERIYNEKYRDADSHKRTPSGTAIPGTATKQLARHHQNSSVELPGAYPETDNESGSDEYQSDQVYDETDDISTDYSEDVADEAEEESIYEEPEDPNVIPHEQRDDAFDYEHFFLHSAMGSYNSGRITPDTDLSDSSSITSTETARAPQHQAEDDAVEYFSDQDEDEIPPMPGTPDALKSIEARLKHGRTVSTESISTINTYATANDHGILSRSTSRLDIGERAVSRSTSRQDINQSLSRSTSRQDIAPERAVSRAASRLSLSQVPEVPRPGTAMRGDALSSTPALPDLDNSSDRADSGVGGIAHANGRVTPKPTAANASSAVSAPSSPASNVDPTALAFRSLLDPAGKQLGEKDKAILSGVIESLRRVCVRLQEEDQYESKVLRRRLDDARRVLDGLGVSESDS